MNFKGRGTKMSNRLTRRIDEWPCRIADGCPAEEWIYAITGSYKYDEEPCDNCPFEKYINRLAEYEDEAERMEEDKK